MVLEDKIRKLHSEKGLLLMPHLVLGYPSFEENHKLIGEMVSAGADIIEMQIPFSEPMADGPVILKANDEALKRGVKVSRCLEFARDICASYPNTVFLFMTYYNILFSRGISKFVSETKISGIQGIIVPDLPPEEGKEYIAACETENVNPIFIFTPTSTLERLKFVARFCRGLVYCVGRKGVTGLKTSMDETLSELIRRFRIATTLPIALGFGIQEKDDIEYIKNSVEIAVIGTKILTLHEKHGVKAVGKFLRELRF